MSEFQVNTVVQTVYAINSDRPPSAWMSEWTLLNDLRVSGADVPPGFWEVDLAEYKDALKAQQTAIAQKTDQINNGARVTLSERRKAAVAAGMTVEIARILIPDPNNDYSIDNNW